MTRKLLGSAVILCAAILSHAQVPVQPILQPHQFFVDGSGSPCAGCSLYSYAAGSTTPLATYTDSTGTSQNTNPIVLDVTGSAQVWTASASSYKFVLKDTGGVTQWTVDNVGNTFPGGVTADGLTPPGIIVQGNIAARTGTFPTSIFPLNSRVAVDGASVTVGYNGQNEVHITTFVAGSGYSGAGTATSSGGTCVTQPTFDAVVDPNGGISVAQETPGNCTVAPTVAIAGFTGGVGASVTVAPYPNPFTDPWPFQLTQLPAWKNKIVYFHNYATNGQTVAGMLANYTTNNYAAYCGDATHTNYFILAGDAAHNSILNSAVSATTAHAQWLALAHSLRAAGCKVIVTTGAPKSGAPPATYNTLLQFNDLITRMDKQGQDYDYILDFAARQQNSADPLFLAPIDLTHLLHGGHVAYAGWAQADLNAGGTPTAGASTLYNSPLVGPGGVVVYGTQIGAPASSATLGWLANQTYLTSASNGGGYGSFDFVGQTSAGASNNLLLMNSSTAAFNEVVTSTFNFNATLDVLAGRTVYAGTGGVDITGTGVGAAPASMALGYNAGSATGYVVVNSNAASAGALNIVGEDNTSTQTTYLGFASGGAATFNAAVTAPSYKVGSNTVIPSTATGNSGSPNGAVSLVQTGLSTSTGGGALAAGACATGTAAIANAATGHPALAVASDGSVQGNYVINASVVGIIVTVNVCAITAGTPTAKFYNVVVF